MGNRFERGTHLLPRMMAVSLVVASCGGGGTETGGSPPGTIRTLVYAPAECREDATQRVIHQELRIQRIESAAVTVTDATETVTQKPPVFPGACGLAGMSRNGLSTLFAGGIQRIGVSPDGSAVVFEKTNRFSTIGLPQLGPEREGFFVVRADGSDLRRLGPASRNSLTRLVFDASSPNGLITNLDPVPLSFSADGRSIVFTDRGPGPTGEDAFQIVRMDLVTGARTQVTRLPLPPPFNPPNPVGLEICCPTLLRDGTIIFGFGDQIYTIKPDGTDLRLLPFPVAVPGSMIDPTFRITSDRPTMVQLGNLPGGSVEVFLYDRGNLLQLSNFGRPDTLRGTVDFEGQRAFFLASADPLGTNLIGNCQIFSTSTLGSDLQQLTNFSQGGRAPNGCFGGGPPGCSIASPFQEDQATRGILFTSSCDPFGANPMGEQIFAMNPDGSNLRQLTETRGFTTEADGTVDAELFGPFASTAVER